MARLAGSASDPDAAPAPSVAPLARVNGAAARASEANDVEELRAKLDAAERRNARLARATAAVRASSERLTDEKDLGKFLGYVLEVFVAELGALGGAVWLGYDETGRRVVAASYEEGRVVFGDASFVARGERSLPPDVVRASAHYKATVRGELSYATRADIETAPHYATHREALLSCGVRTIIGVPLFIDDAKDGNAVTLRFSTDRVLDAADEELAFALAQQVVLAIKLTRLADAAKEAALAKEREETAKRRAKVLERANRAMRAAVARLAERAELDAFLGEILRVAATELGAAGAGVWTIGDVNESLFLSYEDGGVRRAVASAHAGAALKGRDARDRQNALHSRGEITRDGWEKIASEPHYAPFREQYAAHGIRTMIAAPMMLGDALRGVLTLRFTDDRFLGEDEKELFLALANQAVLALELTRLSDMEREAAVTRGRLGIIERANQALRRTTDALAEQPALDAFLRQALRALVETFGGVGGTLWRGRTENETFELVLELDGDEFRSGAELQHPTMLLQRRSRIAERPAVSEMEDRLKAGEVVVLDVYADYGFDPETRAYLLERGIATLVNVPLVIGGKDLGRFTIRLKEARTLAREEIELAQALATQATLAMELTRLAAEAQDAALAKEREAAAVMRADKLAEANRALQASVESLATEPDVSRVVGHVLLAITRQLGARSGSVWLNDAEKKVATLAFVIEDGVLTSAASSRHPNATTTAPITDEAALSGSLTPSATPVVTSLGRARDLSLQQRTYLESLGVRALLAVPMVYDGRHVGSFTVRLEDDRDPLREDLELVQTLATQATFALQLTELAARTQEKALAEEREAAAKARAEKLAAANLALQASVDSLATEPDVSRVVGHVLLAITRQLGARSSTAWFHELSSRRSRLAFVVEDGVLIRGADSHHPNATHDVHFDNQGMPDQGTSHARPVVNPVATDRSLTDGQRAFLERQGVRALLGVPMVFGGRHVGSLTVRLEDDRDPLREDLELVQTLATQATFALQLTELAARTQEKALAEEREAAAEQRAAKLAEANRALQQTAESLTTEPDIAMFLGHVLAAVTRQLGARSSAAWLYDLERGESRLMFVVEDGVTRVGSDSRHPNATKPAALGTTAMAGFGGPGAASVLVPIDEDPALTTEQRDYLRGLGVRALLAIPMVHNGKHLGGLTVRIEGPRDPLAEDLLLVQALANQATFALLLSQLAERATDAAVARTQEEAARLRAEALARIAQAGRDSLQKLADEPRVDAFLGHVLTVCVDQLGAVGGAIWTTDDSGVSRLRLSLEDGVVRAAHETAHPGVAGARDDDQWTRGTIRVDDADAIASSPAYAPYRDYLAKHSIRTMMTLPLYIGTAYRGNMTLRFTGDQRLTPERAELAHALANQAVLALELDRLSEQARVAAVLEERNRLARDIHDTLAQGLAAIIRQLEVAAKPFGEGGAVSTPQLALAMAIARENLLEARRSIRALRPLALETGSLVDALHALVRRKQALTGALLSFQVSGPRAFLPQDLEDELLRIATEALSNARKHAQASKVEVELLYEEGSVRLVIRDDGRGFSLDEDRGGVGLSSIRERAALARASVTIVTEPGRGTEIIVFWSQAGTEPS